MSKSKNVVSNQKPRFMPKGQPHGDEAKFQKRVQQKLFQVEQNAHAS